MRPSRPVATNFLRTALAAGFLLTLAVPAAKAQFTWNLATGSSWNTDVNWNPATAPNAEGASVTFNGAATANNPAQTANRTITLDGGKTVGSIVFNTDLSTFTNSITTGTGGPLTFDQTGAGPATITTMGAGTGNNTISVAMSLTDSLTAFVNNTTATSAAGSLNLTAAISGAGGFTKEGDGLATFGTGAKTYTGATVLNGGRMRMSLIARPSANSSFTINAGAQLTLIAAGTFDFGTGPLNLNGTGATTGPFAAFPGAIRNDTGLVATITNPVVLQSNTLIHVQATAGTGASTTPTGSTTLSGNVSGPGRLTLTAPGSNVDQGLLTLTGTNSYSGGTTVAGGILVAGATSVSAFGTGDVTVDNATSPSSIARLRITTGATNAIDDAATLTLAGGGTTGVADQNFADLQAGVNEIVGALVLGGMAQAPGTYGATGSGAATILDEYFTGTGIVTVVPVPEPGTILAVAAAGLGLFGVARRRRVPCGRPRSPVSSGA